MQIIMDILALFSLISIIKLIMNIDKSRRSKIDSKRLRIILSQRTRGLKVMRQ